MVIKQLFTLPPQPVISSPDCDPAIQAPFSRSADGVSAVVGDAPQDMAGPKKALGRTSNRRAEVAGAWTWQLAQEHDAIDGCGPPAVMTSTSMAWIQGRLRCDRVGHLRAPAETGVRAEPERGSGELRSCPAASADSPDAA